MPETDSGPTLIIRRRYLLAAFLAVALLGNWASRAGWDYWADSFRETANQWFGAYTDELFAEMLRAGAVRPVKPVEVDAWLEKAAKAGNGEISQYAGSLRTMGYVAMEPVRLPKGMHGAHSKVFLILPGGTVPMETENSHNTFLFLEHGTCTGSFPGCSI